MNKFLFIVPVLLGLAACGEENSSATNKAATQSTDSKELQQAKAYIDSTVKTVNGALSEQKNQLDESLGEIAQSLDSIGKNLQNNLEIKESDVNDIAAQLGQLAKKAGESAKTLEKTTQTIGEALQKGFAEGYNKNTDEK